MVFVILLCYFAIENFAVWKTLSSEKTGLRKSREQQSQANQKAKAFAYFLWILVFIRDLFIMEGIKTAKADMIYSIASQRIMFLQSIIALFTAIGCRFWAIKTVPILQTFYPIYVKTPEPSWDRNIWHPYYLSSLIFFMAGFLWQPSSTALLVVISFPVLVQGSMYFQENCMQLEDWIKKWKDGWKLPEKSV
jgi:hypothetical protein